MKTKIKTIMPNVELYRCPRTGIAWIDELELHEKQAISTGDTDLIDRINPARSAITKASR